MNLRTTAKTNMSKELVDKIYELCALCEEIKKNLPYDKDYAFTTSVRTKDINHIQKRTYEKTALIYSNDTI